MPLSLQTYPCYMQLKRQYKSIVNPLVLVPFQFWLLFDSILKTILCPRTGRRMTLLIQYDLPPPPFFFPTRSKSLHVHVVAGFILRWVFFEVSKKELKASRLEILPFCHRTLPLSVFLFFFWCYTCSVSVPGLVLKLVTLILFFGSWCPFGCLTCVSDPACKRLAVRTCCVPLLVASNKIEQQQEQ